MPKPKQPSISVISFTLGYDNRPNEMPYWDKDDIFYPYHIDCRLTLDLEGTIDSPWRNYSFTLRIYSGYSEQFDIHGVAPVLVFDDFTMSGEPQGVNLMRRRFSSVFSEPKELDSYIGVLWCNGVEIARASFCISPVPKDPAHLFKLVRGVCEVGLVGEDRSVPLRFRLTINSVLPYTAQIALGMHWYGGNVDSITPRSGQHKGRDYQLVMLIPDTDVEVLFEFVTSYSELLQTPEFAFLLVMADDDICWIYQHMTIESLFDGFDTIVDFSMFQLESRYACIEPMGKRNDEDSDFLSCIDGGNLSLTNKIYAPQSFITYLDYLEKKRYFDAARVRMGHTVQNVYHHYVFTGKRGVGKYSAAKELHQRLRRLDSHIGRLIKVDVMELLDSTNGYSPKIEEFIDAHSGDFIYIENADALMLKGAIGSLNGIEVLANKLSICEHVRVVLSGRYGPLSELINMCEQARVLFKHIYHFEDIVPSDLLQSALKQIEAMEYTISENAINVLSHYLEHAYRLRGKNFSNLNFVTDLLVNNILPHLVERSVGEGLLGNDAMHKIEACDIPQLEHRDATEALAKMESLVGLGEVKRSILNHTSLVQINRSRANLGIYNKMPPMHMVFTGNPGTGKTTIAQYLGEIYYGIGALSSGHLVETDRSKLVGQYLGETEKNTLNAIERASGGVLFIDEAYNLFVEGQDKRDFGHRVIETLLTYLSQEDSDMIVVLAGYTNEMKQLLESNPGLKSRFPYIFHFDDYTPAQLMKIGQMVLSQEQYVLTSEAEEALSNYVIEEYDNKDEHFGNGRFITRLIKSHIIPALSRRLTCIPMDTLTEEMLCRVEVCDIPNRHTQQLESSILDETIISNVLQQLDQLVGLQNAKRALHDLETFTRVLKEQGHSLLESQNLMWKFAGNSGMGKHTVARLLGRLLQGLGVLKRGHLVLLNAEEFMTLSQPLPTIEQALIRAENGVLFIDMDSPNYKSHSVEPLHLFVESKIRELKLAVAVVYAESNQDKEALARNLAQNGITSFDNYVVFDDYSVDQLIAIFKQLLQQRFGLDLDKTAEQEMRKYVQGVMRSRPKGNLVNARTMLLLAQSVAQIAQLRLANMDNAIKCVLAVDVEHFEWRDPDLSKRVGFVSY